MDIEEKEKRETGDIMSKKRLLALNERGEAEVELLEVREGSSRFV